MDLSTVSSIFLLFLFNFAILKAQQPQIGAYQVDYKHKVIQVIGNVSNSDLVLPELPVEENYYEGIAIKLICNASRPVQWVYRGLGAPIAHVETFRQSLDFNDYHSFRFSSAVTFTHTDSAYTGNYSCEGITDPSDFKSSFYIYSPGSKIFINGEDSRTTILYKEDEIDDLNLINSQEKSEKKPLTIPCATSNPNASVELFKIDSKNVAKKVENFDKFDPKIGFVLKDNGSDIFGSYFCKAEENETIYFDLVDGSEMLKDELTIEFRSGNKEKPRISCCHKGGQVPDLKMISCYSKPDCDLNLGHLRRKEICPQIQCPHFSEDRDNSCNDYEMYLGKNSGLLECSAPGQTSKYFYFSYSDGQLFEKFNNFKNETTPETPEITRDEYIDRSRNKTVERFICHTNSFFYSHGIRWAWQKPDGTLEIVNQQNGESEMTYNSKLTVDKDELISLNRTTLYCFAPFWNSPTHWKPVSILVN